jgi:hypothetical protein
MVFLEYLKLTRVKNRNNYEKKLIEMQRNDANSIKYLWKNARTAHHSALSGVAPSQFADVSIICQPVGLEKLKGA